MLGNRIISFGHLARSLSVNVPRRVVLTSTYGNIDVALTVRLEDDTLLIYSNLFFALKLESPKNVLNELRNICGGDEKKFQELIEKHINCIALSKEYYNTTVSNLFSMYLLPDTFDKDVDMFIKENKKIIRRSGLIMDFSEIGVTEIGIVEKLYCTSNASKGIFEWVLSLYIKHNVNLTNINFITNWYSTYPQLVKNLSKKSLTSYSYLQINDLIDEIIVITEDKRAKDAINMFNTTQRNLLKELPAESVRIVLPSFLNLPAYKRTNFIKKMSSVTDVNELIKQLEFITSGRFSWSREGLLEYVKNVDGMKAKVTYDNNNVMVLKVKDYNTIKHLGKMTSWCITKNKAYWNNYITEKNGSNQYMIFNFNKPESDRLSTIGVTVSRESIITASHDYYNNNLLAHDCAFDINGNYSVKSYYNMINESNTIKGIIKRLDIGMESFANKLKVEFDWNKESFLEYFNKIGVNKYNINILKDSDNKLVVSVIDSNMRNFAKGKLIEMVSDITLTSSIAASISKYLMFLDFNKSKNDYTRMYIAEIVDACTDEETCRLLLDMRYQTVADDLLDDLLLSYDLPFDIISRPYNKYEVLEDALYRYSIPTLKRLIKDKEDFMKFLVHFKKERFINILASITFQYGTSDLIDLIYSIGSSLYETIGEIGINELTERLALLIRETSREASLINNDYANIDKLDDTIRKIEEGEIDSVDVGRCVSYMLCFKKIVDNEFKNLNRAGLHKVVKNICAAINLEKNIGIVSILKYTLSKLTNASKDTVNLVVNALEWTAYSTKKEENSCFVNIY